LTRNIARASAIITAKDNRAFLFMRLLSGIVYSVSKE
jgi:hypothetical protein